jgi:hypothetical protein
MAKKSTYTPAQIEEMRAAVAAADAEAAETARIEKDAFFEPLKTALDNDCGRSFYASLDALRESFDGDEYSENANIRAHLGAILSIMPNFYAAAGVELTPSTETETETNTEPSTDA